MTQLEVMALFTFKLWRRTVPCPIYILETFNRMTTACDKNHLVKNSSDLSSWKQNNNFWHSSSFSPYQQPLYLSMSSKSFLPYFTHSVQDRTHFATFLGTEPTRPSSLLSHHMTAKCAYYIQKVICKPSWPMTKCHVTIPVIIITVLMRLMTCFWHWLYFQAEWCSKKWSVAQVLTLLSFCCLYFAFTGSRCLYSAYM